MFDAYRNRVYNKGNTYQESVRSSTKRKVKKNILNSPSLSHVILNDNTQTTPCLVSDIQTFYERRFLFEPEFIINLGEYITYQGYKYLVTNKTMDDIYPQAFGELCNVEYPIYTKQTKVATGEREANGKPIYNTITTTITKPAVMSGKIYSQANNSSIPLPDGALIIKLPYSDLPNHLPKINSYVILNGNQYDVNTVSMQHVVNNVGYVEVQVQRTPTT